MTLDPHIYLPTDDWQKDAFIETYRSLNGLLTDGLRILGLANSGAVVALMTLVGAFVGKSDSYPDVRNPVAWFVCGLALVMLAYFTAFFSQTYFLQWLATKNMTRLRDHRRWYSVAVICVVGSIAFFGLGAASAIGAFSRPTRATQGGAAKGTVVSRQQQ